MTLWEYFLTGLAVCGICTIGAAVLGRLLLRSVGEESVARRVHGRCVYWWSLAGVAVSGPLLPSAAPDAKAFAGWALFCMLVGWLVGTVHGGLVLGVKSSGG